MVLLAATITFSSSITAFAATVDTSPEANNKKYAATEKVNKNALNHYKQQSEQFSQSYIDYLNKTAQSITDGISDNYAKTKAISSYVSENLWYDQDFRYNKQSEGKKNYFNPNDDGNRGSAGIEIIAGDKGLCEDYAAFTVSLLRAANIPTKEVWGHYGSASHAWVLAYVDGKWLLTDPTFASQNKVYKGVWSEQKASSSDYFDWSYDRWSLAYYADDEATSIVNADLNTDFNGKLWFYSTYHGTIQNLIKQVDTDLSAGDKLNSTYGFEAKDLYKDALCTEPWDMDEDVVTEADTLIYIKNYKSHQTADTTTTTTADTTADTNTATTTTDETTTPTTTTNAPIKKITGWYARQGHWTFYGSKGLITSDWLKHNNIWYYFDDLGFMKTGWLKDNGKWYYLTYSGAMAHDTTTPDGYTVGSDGAWIN